MLNIIILKSGDKDANIDRTMASFINNSFACTLTPGTVEDIGNSMPHLTSHYGYIYDNEWLEGELAKALPVFLNVNSWDVLVMLKKVKIDNKYRIFETPRIFKSNVKLQGKRLIPEKDPQLIYERVLNGWVLENDRVG